jgi:hypothetical protein
MCFFPGLCCGKTHVQCGIALDLGAADALDEADLGGGQDVGKGGLHFGAHAGPRIGTEDREAAHIAPAGGDVAVAEVLAEQVGVLLAIQRRRGAAAVH